MCPLYGGRLWFTCSCGTWKKSPLYEVSALERFYYKGFLRNFSEAKLFVHLREVCALEDVRFREVPLYNKKHSWHHWIKDIVVNVLRYIHDTRLIILFETRKKNKKFCSFLKNKAEDIGLTQVLFWPDTSFIKSLRESKIW